MGGLVFGTGSVTQGQLVALCAVALVLIFLLSANLTVCWLYRRATSEDQRRSRRERLKKSEMWVYHVHRSNHVATENPDSAAQQILRRLQASHNNLRAKLKASSSGHEERQISLRREEAQALEKLEVTTDLFLHDTSCSSSQPSSFSTVSVRGGGGGGLKSSSCGAPDSERRHHLQGASSTSEKHHPETTSAQFDFQPASNLNNLDPRRDLDIASTFSVTDPASAPQEIDMVATAKCDLDVSSFSYDTDVASALADLDMVSVLYDLDSTVSDTDRVSMYGVTLADFENDDATDPLGKTLGRKKGRWSKRRGSGRQDNRGAHSLPVAEFHNEAFDFCENRAVVERVKDMEL